MTDVLDVSINTGKCSMRKEMNNILVDDFRENIGFQQHKINIPLFTKIACFTSVRRSYKNIMLQFYDELKNENIKGFFASKRDLENATQACGTPGGRIAFLLGLFCRYYNKLPRNVNVVLSSCEKCIHNSSSNCGKLVKCGDYYGCGKGVSIPLDPSFNIASIPEIRIGIQKEGRTFSDI